MILAHAESQRLQVLAGGLIAECLEAAGKVGHRGTLLVRRHPEGFGRQYEVAVIPHGIACQLIQQRMGLRRGFGRIAGDIGPELGGIGRIGYGHKVHQEREADRARPLRRAAGMDVPDRIFQLRGGLFLRELLEEGEVFVHGLGDDVEVKLLRHARLLELEQRQALVRGIGQPLLNRDTIALGLGNLFAFLVQEQFVDILFRRAGAQDAADLGIDGGVGLMVLAEHFKVHTKRSPAHTEIRLPLHLHRTAGDWQRHIRAVFIRERDFAARRVHLLHRHIQHAACARADRQEGRIGGPPLLPQGWKHHIHDRLVLLRCAQQHRVKPAGLVAVGCRKELVLEAEFVEEGAETRIHVRAIGRMGAERIGHRGQRLLEEGFQRSGIGHGIGNLPHTVHVIGHADQARGIFARRQHLKRMTDHCGTHNFAEGANMRQARGTVASLEDDRRVCLALACLNLLGHALFQRARKLERPGLGSLGECRKVGHLVVSHY